MTIFASGAPSKPSVGLGGVLVHRADTHNRTAHAASAVIPLGLALLAIAVPYFLAHGFLFLGVALQRGFGLVCHQRPERSFYLFGSSVAVCARCLGVYLGVAFGAMVRVQRRLAFSLLASAIAVNLIDWATESAGLHANWLGMRLELGIMLGAAAAMLVRANLGLATSPTSA